MSCGRVAPNRTQGERDAPQPQENRGGGTAMLASGMIAAMLEEPEGPRNPDGHMPPRRWRWAAPIGAAVLVVGVVVGIVVAQPPEDDLPAAGDGASKREPKYEWKPRFLVTAGRTGDVSGTA